MVDRQLSSVAPFRNPAKCTDGKRIGFSIPGEVTDGFLSQIAMFDFALRKLPKPWSDARLLAYLGCEDDTEVPQRWLPYLENVEIHLVRRPRSEEKQYAQASMRFFETDPNLDFVFLCDADTLPIGTLDGALSKLTLGFPVVGALAHAPPEGFTPKIWETLSQKVCGKSIALPYEYQLLSAAQNSAAPFYLNHGCIGFRMDALREFQGVYTKMRADAKACLVHKEFAGQVGLTLATNLLDWEGCVLPNRFNFPNDHIAFALHYHEGSCARLIHYLRETQFLRSELFASQTAFDAFVAIEPNQQNRAFHAAVLNLTHGVYPFV